MILATQIRRGNILKIDGDLYRVMDRKHVTPGKGHAHVQVKLRSLKDGNQRNERYNSSDKVEKAILETRPAEYLYEDSGVYFFMDNESYETIELHEEMVGDDALLMLPNTTVDLVVHDGNTLGIELPKVVVLEVVETEPHMKGATAASQNKPAKLETGLVVQVPPFIKAGEKIRVDTENVAYIERHKE